MENQTMAPEKRAEFEKDQAAWRQGNHESDSGAAVQNEPAAPEAVSPEMTPQGFLRDYEALKARLKEAADALEKLQADFAARFGDWEYPVEVDGKRKFVRVYAPEGFWATNRKWEVGIRAKAEKPAPGC